MNKFKQPRNSGRIVFVAMQGNKRAQVIKHSGVFAVDLYTESDKPPNVVAPLKDLESAKIVASNFIKERVRGE
jgi:hypothetical protein